MSLTNRKLRWGSVELKANKGIISRSVVALIVLFQLIFNFPLYGSVQEVGLEEINIPDVYLKSEINYFLHKRPDSKIYKSELEGLTYLRLVDKKISNLEGLQHASNLQTLDLSGNTIIDLKPIENLHQLRRLYLSSTPITNFDSVANLVNLTELDLSNNQISDLRPISYLKNLTNLYLNSNLITDLSPLSNLLNLESLSLGENKIADITKLSTLSNLQSLDLYDNEITDISPLSSLTKLTEVLLDRNFIPNKQNQYSFTINKEYHAINVFEGGKTTFVMNWFYNGEESFEYIMNRKNQFTLESKNQKVRGSYERNSNAINVDGTESGQDELTIKFANPELNQIIHVNVIEDGEVNFPDSHLKEAINSQLNRDQDTPILKSELTQLEFIGANSKGIKNLEGLQYASNIISLNLSGNQITDISPIANLTKLYSLSLDQNQITDITPLVNLKNLFGPVYLNHNQINDLSPLAKLTNLNSLFLNNNKIVDISPLSKLTNLFTLVLDINPIKDSSPLVNLTSLSYLGLSSTNISDISHLSHLTKLSSLGLGNLGLTDIRSVANLKSLEYLGLDHNKIIDIKPLSGLTNLNHLYLDYNQITDSSPIDSLDIEYLNLKGNFIKGKSDQYSYSIPESHKAISVGNQSVVIPVIWNLGYSKMNELDDYIKQTLTIKTKNNHVEAVLQNDGSVLVKGISDGEDEVFFQFANPALNQKVTITHVDVTPPAAPVVNELTDIETKLTGKAEPGSTVIAKVSGKEIGRVNADVDGKISMTIPVQKAGIKITITAIDKLGNVSEGTTVVVKADDTTAPHQPTVTEITNHENFLSGIAEVGSTVIAKVNGKEIGRSTADDNGKFNITIPVQAAGKMIEVYAVDKMNNVSTSVKMVVTEKLKALIGATRYSTAVKVSQTGWTASNSVLLVNGNAIVDGLTATPLASAKNAPILLTTTDFLPPETLEEMKRLKAKEIVLIGGTGVISPKVENALKAQGFTVKRIGGSDRYATSLIIAKELDKLVDVETAFVAYGRGEPDALSIAAQAGLRMQPIILTDKNAVPAATMSWLRTEGLSTAYFIGGTIVISPSIISEFQKITSQNLADNRISGMDRHETNGKVMMRFYQQGEVPTILVAKSETKSLVDALAAGPLAAKLGAPVLLASAYNLSFYQLESLSGVYSKYVHQIGGGVNENTVNQIVRLNR
jgi:Leucine-rich repeat (LRR) protein/putative cell wall-binding protein